MSTIHLGESGLFIGKMNDPMVIFNKIKLENSEFPHLVLRDLEAAADLEQQFLADPDELGLIMMLEAWFMVKFNRTVEWYELEKQQEGLGKTARTQWVVTTDNDGSSTHLHLEIFYQLSQHLGVIAQPGYIAVMIDDGDPPEFTAWNASVRDEPPHAATGELPSVMMAYAATLKKGDS